MRSAEKREDPNTNVTWLRERLIPIILRSCRRALILIGIFAIAMLILAFTRLPFDAHRKLGISEGLCTGEVDVVLILGGSGMPSGPELLRLHHGAMMAQANPNALVVVVHPKDTSVIRLMLHELTLKGVDPGSIRTVLEGTNTRDQAMIVSERFAELKNHRIAVVTAPENMYRTLKAFRKLGFSNTCGAPAFDHAMFIDLGYDHRKLGGKVLVPDVSTDLDLRYNFWNYLKLEITCLREYAAIAYYWINGWI